MSSAGRKALVKGRRLAIGWPALAIGLACARDRLACLGKSMLWSWGDNACSQLGGNTSADGSQPRRLPSPQRVHADAFLANIIAVVAGDAHCMALDELGAPLLRLTCAVSDSLP